MTFRIGLVGGGFLAWQSLVPAIAAASDLDLVAVLDPDPQAWTRIRPAFPAARYTADIAEFLATPMDGVHVLPPNHLHAAVACATLGKGIPLLVDKPLADTVAAGADILRAATAAGVPALIGYMSQLNATNRAVLELLRTGSLGAPRTITAVHFGHRLDDWRTRRAEAGLGSLGDLAIYPLLTAGDIFDAPPSACRATGFPAGDSDRSDIYAEATVWFGQDRRLQLESSFTEAPGVGVSRYTVICDQGVVVVRGSWAMNGGGTALVCQSGGRRWLDALPVDPYAAQYRRFADCVAGAPVPAQASIARALRDLTTLHEIDRSIAERGTPRTLNGAQRQ